MPEITKGLLRAALERYTWRLKESLGSPVYEASGEIERMFRDVKAIQKELCGLYQAEIAKEKMRLEVEQLQRQR